MVGSEQMRTVPGCSQMGLILAQGLTRGQEPCVCCSNGGYRQNAVAYSKDQSDCDKKDIEVTMDGGRIKIIQNSSYAKAPCCHSDPSVTRRSVKAGSGTLSRCLLFQCRHQFVHALLLDELICDGRGTGHFQAAACTS